MNIDNKEGAGVPVAWEVRNAEISYRAVFGTEREARLVADEHDESGYSQAVVRALYATPPAVMPLADHKSANVSDNESCGSSVSDNGHAVMPAAPSDAVLQLLNHIEDVVGDEDWERIDHKLWNAVTAQYATLKPQAKPAAGEQAGAVADDSVARLNGAVAGLQGAVIFLDQMRKAAKDGEDVTGTGAARDAREWLESAARALLDTLSAPPAAPGAAIAAREQEPIDMVLHCPKCGLQHIDNREHGHGPYGRTVEWDNPPHRSHLCHACGHIWRPADVPTNGVQAVKTTGKADSPIPSREEAPATPQGEVLTDAHDKRNAAGAPFAVEDLKLPLPALPEPFIASTEIGYSLHRAPEVLRFGADCYRLALTQPTTVQQAPSFKRWKISDKFRAMQQHPEGQYYAKDEVDHALRGLQLSACNFCLEQAAEARAALKGMQPGER